MCARIAKIRENSPLRCFCDNDAAHLELEFVPVWSQRTLTLQPGSRTPTRPYQVSAGFARSVQTPLPPECSIRTQNNSSPREKRLQKSSPFPFSLEPPASLPQLHSWHTSPGMASEVSRAGWSISCSDSPAWDANFLFLHSRKGHESFRACFSSPCPLV